MGRATDDASSSSVLHAGPAFAMYWLASVKTVCANICRAAAAVRNVNPMQPGRIGSCQPVLLQPAGLGLCDIHNLYCCHICADIDLQEHVV